MSAAGAAMVAIRDATPEDAIAACDVLKESISRLCVADHRNGVDPVVAPGERSDPGDRDPRMSLALMRATGSTRIS